MPQLASRLMHPPASGSRYPPAPPRVLGGARAAASPRICTPWLYCAVFTVLCWPACDMLYVLSVLYSTVCTVSLSVLYCTVCTALCCTVLCCTVLYCLYCTEVCCLYCAVYTYCLYCTVLYCTVLYCLYCFFVCAVLHCVYCTVLCCTLYVLYCTFCTVLYCTLSVLFSVLYSLSCPVLYLL
jgi:hypothetical protein